MDPSRRKNELVSYFVSAFGVFYGLMLGLIAVGTYETFSQIEERVAIEAGVVASIYSDVSMFPEPVRSKLQADVCDYVTVMLDEGLARPGPRVDQRVGRSDSAPVLRGPAHGESFRGEFCVSPEPFQNLLDQMMKAKK